MDRQEDGLRAEQEEAASQEHEQAPPGTRGRGSAEAEGQQGAMEMPMRSLTTGQIVDGMIVRIDEQGAFVDVGTKSEGHISREELAGGTTDDGRPLEVGDRVAVYVVRPEGEAGTPVLSKKRADYERVWQRLTKAYEEGEALSAMVTDRVKGGLVVDLGVRGFLPASHVQTRNVRALDRFVGQSVKVKIIEVDRGRKRVVVSQRQALEQERRERREKTLLSLRENQVYKGIVRRITDYGAFVDLGGVDGLLHVTEMAWTRIEHPSEVVKVGDKIDVMVLRFDREQNRISLGLKQILPDPWEDARERYQVGQTVAASVSRLVPFGAFVRLEDGIEAIVPNAELPGERGQRAPDVLKVGEVVRAKVVNIRPGERRMTLSLRQVEQAEQRRELREYMARQEESSRVTIGDLVGDLLSEHAAGRDAGGEEPQPERESAAEPEAPQPQELPEPDEDQAWSSSGSPGESEQERA